MAGCHLFVRCPKWTPLSNNAFMEITLVIIKTPFAF